MKKINKDLLRLAVLTAESASLQAVHNASTRKATELGLDVDDFKPFDPLEEGEPRQCNFHERSVLTWIESVKMPSANILSTDDHITAGHKKAENEGNVDNVKTLGKLVASLKQRFG